MSARQDIAPGKSDELSILLGMMDGTSAEVKAAVASATDEQVQWREPNVGRSIGVILLHLADAEYWWIQCVALGKPGDQAIHDRLLSSELDQFAGIWPDAPSKPTDWYLSQVADIRDLTNLSLRACDPAATIGKYRDREYSLRWIMHHLVEHEAYHLGQIQMLLEMQDA